MIATMLAGALAAACLVMRRAPDAPIARLLHRWIVEWPASALLRIERRHLIFVLVAIVSTQAFLSVGLPDAGMLLAWDISTYVDILLVTWTLTAASNIKAIGRLAAHRWQSIAARPHHRSQPRRKRSASRRPARPTPSANDDDRPALASAA